MNALAEVRERGLEMLALLPVAALMWDNTKRIIFANQLTLEMLGFELTELENEMLSEVIPEPGLTVLLEQLTTRKSSPLNVRCLLNTKCGHTFMGELLISPLPQNVGHLAVLSNISSRYQQEELIQNRYEFLQALIDAVPLPIFYRDGNGYAIGCNRAFEDLLNLGREEIAFLSLNELLPEEQAKRLKEMDAAVRSEHKTITTELSLPHASGELRDYAYYLSAYYSDNDEIECLLSVLVDITDRNYAEAALLKSYHELQATRDEVVRLERRSSAMAMAVTANHEINQPLMIAKGNLEMLMLRLGELPEKEMLYATRLSEAIKRIENILYRFRTSVDVQFTDYSNSTEMAILVSEEENKDV